MAAVLLHGHPQLPYVTLLSSVPSLSSSSQLLLLLGVGNNKRMKRSVSIHSFLLRQTHHTYNPGQCCVFMMCKGTPNLDFVFIEKKIFIVFFGVKVS